MKHLALAGAALLLATSAGAQEASYEKDAKGRIAAVISTRGVTRYTYFADGLIASVENPDGTREIFRHENIVATHTLAEAPREPAATSRQSAFDASHNRFAFTGHYFDVETGLYYAGARFYDPQFGRFTSADTFAGHLDDPPSLHKYLYANANPLRYVDPTGHQTIGADYCRAYKCSTETQHAVNPPARVVDAVNGAADATLEKTDFVLSTAFVHAWNSTLGNPGHNARPEVLTPYPQPKDDTEALLGAATMLTVDVSPALVRGGRRASEPPRTVPADLVAPPAPRSLSKVTTTPLPGRTAAQVQAAKPMGFLEGTVVEDEGQLASTARDATLPRAADSSLGAEVTSAPPAPSSAAAKGRTYITYELKNAQGEVVYVGRASGVGTPDQVMQGRLARGHDVFDANPGLTAQVKAVQESAAANKGAEGVLYAQRLREGAKLLNDPKSPPLSSKPSKADEVRAKVEAYHEDLKQP